MFLSISLATERRSHQCCSSGAPGTVGADLYGAFGICSVCASRCVFEIAPCNHVHERALARTQCRASLPALVKASVRRGRVESLVTRFCAFVRHQYPQWSSAGCFGSMPCPSHTFRTFDRPLLSGGLINLLCTLSVLSARMNAGSL